MRNILLWYFLSCILLLASCGDLSDTCISHNQYTICYYEEEGTQPIASQMLDYLPKAYPELKTNFKINKHSEEVSEYSVLIELNTSINPQKQKSFLQKIADDLSANCFQNKKIRVVAVEDIDALTKGNVSVVSR
ncbi:hypothetical protein QNI19_02415 [Cytophagaceae bacterium DM2B3-1]|uniref:Uncharacterized protein n=1 Tax=Xanthocytophaga flava TaxID=3048013 RepID=A0ABT7CFA6_9BACT|nr:hypothetical protein [Xanthocytophaga flavus]MDJ1491767.1 hypothetical protein [Xanthocytophaga flavus]